MTFSAVAPDTAQTLTLTAFADCYDAVAESDEGNNTRSLSVPVTQPALRPDLIVDSLVPFKDTYETNSQCSFKVTVKNQGEAYADAFFATLSGNGENWTAQVGSLAPGASRILYMGCSTPSKPGELTVTAMADSGFDIDESDEDNNTATASVTIIQSSLPDLTVTGVYPLKESYHAGETVTIQTVIENQGDADAGTFVAQLSPEGAISQTQTLVGLPAGESVTLTWTFTAPVLSETETWSLVVMADSTKIIEEEDETNNTGYGSVTILGERPDLTIASLTSNADRYAPGEVVTMTAVVENRGIVACPGSQVRIDGEGIQEQVRAVPALPAGGSASIMFRWIAPYITGERSYAIEAMADPDHRIPESDERNNRRSGSFTVYNPLPDLTITQILPNKDEYAGGESGTVTVVVSNQGAKTVADSKLKLIIGDFHSEVKQTGAISSGGSTRITFTFTAPEVLERKEVVVTATVDPANEISESNENNNTLSASLAIKPTLPDIGIIGTNATNWYAGKDIVVTATVVNYTGRDVPSVIVRLTVGSDRYEEAIPLPGNGSNLAVFRVTLPTRTGATPVTFVVDPYNALPEENEDNNNYERTIQIVSEPIGAVLDPDSPELIEHYEGSGLLPLPSTENSDYHIWQEVRLEGDEYVTKTFWAQMQTVFEVTPDARIAYDNKPQQMESGFGVNTNLTTQITTNYDHPEKLVGCQMAWVYAPETGYGQIAQWASAFDSLERISGAQGALSTRWQQKVNPYSETGSRLHYTPLWFPDGQYTLLSQSFYGWTPSGQMYWFDVSSVDILGDMYDRVTAIQGR